MQGILTAGLVSRAYEVVRPAIEAVLKSGVTDGKDVVIVVTATKDINPYSVEKLSSFADACYLVDAIGDPANSKYPITRIALSKAEISARTGLPTAKVPPQYLLDEDTLYYGSAVLDGIVVACSGVEPYYDEMFSYWIAAAVQAEVKKVYDALRVKNLDFVP